jgi:predicted secreted hydrolase
MNRPEFSIGQSAMPDLSPKPPCDIEWWFVQGWFEGPDIPRRHVMTAFFRMRDAGGKGSGGEMLIQHFLDPESGTVWTDSRITPEAVAVHDRTAQRIVQRNLSEPLARVALLMHAQEVARWNRRAGIVVDPVGPKVQPDQLGLAWNGFALGQSKSGLFLDVANAAGQVLALDLAPSGGWLAARSQDLHANLGAGLAYISCPRLDARGTFDGADVSGRFWFDNQWGRYEHWLLTLDENRYRILGWDWFGINLDDGRDLLLCRHRYAGDEQPRFSWGVVFENGQPRRIERITLAPLRHWTSPRSMASYPVAWNVECPDEKLSLRIEPLIDDQEIPVYGVTSIWEGAVRADGMIHGAAVSGLGRLELFGYGKALTLSDQLRRYLTRFGRDMGSAIALPGSR